MKNKIRSGMPFLALVTFVLLLLNNLQAQDNVDVQFQFKLTNTHLQALPLRDESQLYYGLFAGTIVQDYRGEQQLHVQGSRFDEIDYRFENINIRSAFSGQALFRPIIEGLSQLSLNALPDVQKSTASALISHKIKPGEKGLNFAWQSSSDNFTNSYEKKFDTYSYGYNRNIFLGSGTFWENRINFSTAIEREQYSDHYRRFWPGFTYNIPVNAPTDNFWHNPEAAIFSTGQIEVLPGNIPQSNSDRWAAQTKISSKTRYGKLDFIHLYHRQRQQINPAPIQTRYNPQRIPEKIQINSALSLQWEKDIFKNINTHLQIDKIEAFETTQDAVFEDQFLLYYDSLANVEKGIPWFANTNYFFPQTGNRINRGPGEEQLFYFSFDNPGNVLAADYYKSRESSVHLNFKLSKKIGKHYLESGTRLNKRSMHFFQIENVLGLAQLLQEQPVDLGTYDPNNDSAYESIKTFYNAYGYTFNGDKIDNDADFEGPKKSSELIAFLSDHIQTENHLIKIGLQYARFNNGEKSYADPTNPPVHTWEFDSFPIHSKFLKKTPARGYFLPRLRWDYQLNTRTILGFNWGKFALQPRFQDVYLSHIKRVLNYPWLSEYNFSGATAAPIKSNKFNIYFARQITPGFAVKIGMYYRKSENLLQSKSIELDQTAAFDRYAVLANDGESLSKGLTLETTFKKAHWMVWGNYTLSNVNGPNSYPLTNMIAEHFYAPDYYPLPADRNFDFNQSHRLNLICSFRTNAAKNIAMRNWEITGLYRFNSGHDTPLFSGGYGHDLTADGLLTDVKARNRTNYTGQLSTPWNHQLDVQFERHGNIYGLRAGIFFKIQNVFNRKNILHVYRRTGSAESDQYFQLTGNLQDVIESNSPETINLYRLINDQHRQHYSSIEGGDLFGHPREIRFGLRLEFGE